MNNVYTIQINLFAKNVVVVQSTVHSYSLHLSRLSEKSEILSGYLHEVVSQIFLFACKYVMLHNWTGQNIFVFV